MDQTAERIIRNLQRVIVGKDKAVRLTLAALLSDGHLLIEDVPGLGKTLLARSLARSINAQFKRVQFTPDLLPSDITGVSVYDPQSREFEFREGPVFCQILLADELNRATPRTQSALLEGMEERQVSVDGRTYRLPRPFFVVATQNPIEQQGVYHLPEAQLDRFLMQISLGYPEHEEEKRIVEEQRLVHPLESLESVADASDISALQVKVREVFVEPSVHDYLVRIVAATRRDPNVLLGGSPRASLALFRTAQALTLLEGRPFVLPDTVKEVVKPVLRHRLILRSP